jgi:CRP/FNR family transcriptional regulator, polysaccharide utilization system transcription regulator
LRDKYKKKHMTVFQKSVYCKSCDECNRKSELFKLLTTEESKTINEDRFEVQFKTGENIAKQGTKLTHMVNLTSGLVKIYIEGLTGRSVMLNLIGPNSIIGGPGLFTDGKFHFSVTALEETSVCFINAERFKEVLDANKVFAAAYFKHLSMKQLGLYERLVCLTQKQMHGKLADALLYLSERIYKSTDFELNISRQDIADMTAMSKDSAIRILKEFEKDGIIISRGKNINIPKMEALREISLKG